MSAVPEGKVARVVLPRVTRTTPHLAQFVPEKWMASPCIASAGNTDRVGAPGAGATTVKVAVGRQLADVEVPWADNVYVPGAVGAAKLPAMAPVGERAGGGRVIPLLSLTDTGPGQVVGRKPEPL
jgi:hypothetical protein